MELLSQVTEVKVKKVGPQGCRDFHDALAIEEPLEIQLQIDEGEFKSIAVTMRTPGNDLELALGFLFTEGIIKTNQQIAGHNIEEPSNRISVSMKKGEHPLLKYAERNFYTTSSCGVCGKSSIEAIRVSSSFPIQREHPRVKAKILHQLESKLLKQQAVFSQTGGLHASALFNSQGDFVLLREDVGRHNALDKLIGASFLKNELPLSDKILLLSGRASFELIQKAAMAGIPVVAAVGAPSSLAVSLSKEAGITLIGFLRNDRLNIYCSEERVLFDESA